METKTYTHLSIKEREYIALLRAEKRSLQEIARQLERNVATISRELRRNVPPVHTGYYLPTAAHQRACRRKGNAHRRQRLKTQFIRSYVHQKPSLGWSLEQIAGRLPRDYPTSSISHEALYQYIYKEHQQLIPLLPRAHRKRHLKGHSRKHASSHIPNRVDIDERPYQITLRETIGHWESDTMISQESTSALLVMLERKTRLSPC